ncbi:pyrroline-5-carboxylate reductase [Adhaeretor mobilis]|uniref:Pyrroline-5-carboxylate reductase n=1 Tax=Adhaeretor mobilis TaxID=1930276 RepID=A0A517MZ24_9BACT|nr:pyrroline-5-carboxylate reductase [Adhaeretor mobilis]QDT00141.1 Pyrroline-5-carboxylate reductase [Adhaeretor mobilis]
MLGFIGSGRMATALARGCIEAKLYQAGDVVASDPYEPAREQFAEQLSGVATVEDNAAVLQQADVVFLAVKPQMMDEVLDAIAEHVMPSHLLISIAAGVTLQRLASHLPAKTRLIRVMPNTPCLIGRGACGFAVGASCNEVDSQTVKRILGSVGIVHEVEEQQLDAVTGLSGSGPAFVYSVIESLAAGGVAGGLSEKLSLELAIQTTVGAAEMLTATGKSPAELRDQVTSPGGTTFAGLESLKRDRGQAALQAAVEAATQRSVELGKS